MKGYGQFCPVAKASEIFAQRWTPLIVRELLMGSRRFSELRLGVPGIPTSMLSQRLRDLERVGIVARREGKTSGTTEYDLTQAGQELFEIVESLGRWGQRWANDVIGPDDADPRLLMWDMRRRLNLDRLPDERVVAQFDFTGVKRDSIWLVLERPEPSVCFTDPGFDVDLNLTVDTLTLHRVWMGRQTWKDAVAGGGIEVEGRSKLVRAFPDWLSLSLFAGIAPAR